MTDPTLVPSPGLSVAHQRVRLASQERRARTTYSWASSRGPVEELVQEHGEQSPPPPPPPPLEVTRYYDMHMLPTTPTGEEHMVNPFAGRGAVRPVEELSVEIDTLMGTIQRLEGEKAFLEDSIRESHVAPSVVPPQGVCRARVLQDLMAGHRGLLYDEVRSMGDKLSILREALATSNGDVITTVVLFLRDTLAPTMFAKVLNESPIALRYYGLYLQRRGDKNQLRLTYRACGRKVDEVWILLRQAFDIRMPADRLNAFRVCLQQWPPSEAFFERELKDQIELLRRQNAIEVFDAKLAASGNDPFLLRYPRPYLPYAPVAHTLYYCMLYHPNVSKEKLSSPVNTQKTFKISEKTLTWISLKARARVGDWEAIRKLPLEKKLFSTRMNSRIGFVNFVDVLGLAGAPQEELAYFARLVEVPDDKWELYDLAIEALCQLRDAVRMSQLRNYLVDRMGAVESEPYRQKIDEALKNPKIKWKVRPSS